MTEFVDLYVAVTSGKPKDISREMEKIPGIHQQEALDNALEKAITLTKDPIVQNIKYLLKLGADPNGSEGSVLNYIYTNKLDFIMEILLCTGADPNEKESDILELAVKDNDLKSVVRFVKAGAKQKNNLQDLLTSTTDPKIQKFLLENGFDNPNLATKLVDVITPTFEDFTYPDIGDMDQEIQKTGIDQMYIVNHSKNYFLVRGNTKDNQDLLRRNGGKYIKKFGGWLLPISRKKLIEEKILEVNEPKDITPENVPSPEEFVDGPEISVTPVWSPSPTPIVEDKSDILLYGPHGLHGFLTISYTSPDQFVLDGQVWDSVDRYLMYKMYEGSYKATAIKEAEDLETARRKFLVTEISKAKTPKQLVANQKLLPLVDSKMNNGYLQRRELLLEKANRAKFEQNGTLLRRLLRTGERQIINKNANDTFSYEGNMLGNTLMKLRWEFGGPEFNARTAKKTNNLIIERYMGNKNFYVIRGDPDHDLAIDIRGLGTYKTKNGKVIRGKLNLNLQGGAGWLIPLSNKEQAKELIFYTYPEDKKIQMAGREWLKKRIYKFLEVAAIFSRYRGGQELTTEDLLFSIKDIFGNEDYLDNNDTEPTFEFVKTVRHIGNKHNVVISDQAVKLLWDFLSKMVYEFSQGFENYKEMVQMMNDIEASILETPIRDNPGMNDRESIVVDSFKRIFRILKKISDKPDSKICITVVQIMLGGQHYDIVRELYSKKAKLTGSNEYTDEATQFRRRFKIDNPHIEIILENIPNIDRKCKLLLFVTLEYVLGLEDEEAISISKRLIILSQKGRQISPTPLFTPKYSPKPNPSAFPNPNPSAFPKPTPSASPKPTPSAFPKPTPSASPKPTPSASPKPTPSASPKPTPSASPTPEES